MEMMFHHIVTMYLYVFGYMGNVRMGAVVSLLHDVTDVTITWTRVWAETRHSAVAGVSFLFAQFTWAYFRVYWLGMCIYVTTIKLEIYTASPYMQPSFGFMMACLLTLHIYWQYLMVGILFNYAKKGVAEDTISDVNSGASKKAVLGGK
jgi:hypothetical protein